ncbi:MULTISPECIES: hypothetical protein [unclassified Streptomyces]|uniref:hypothetical protein n=1 Tax=unclassified Streptomyces TaxID=2593676 RepID=UPI002E2C2E2B|nr:hypothetical protein [Streptomyces sp. NBC_00223]
MNVCAPAATVPFVTLADDVDRSPSCAFPTVTGDSALGGATGYAGASVSDVRRSPSALSAASVADLDEDNPTLIQLGQNHGRPLAFRSGPARGRGESVTWG